MRISDWSSDVCSSDLPGAGPDPDGEEHLDTEVTVPGNRAYASLALGVDHWGWPARRRVGIADMRRRGSPDPGESGLPLDRCPTGKASAPPGERAHSRSEEHTSELQSLMRSSYAVFCLKKKNRKHYNRRIQ